MSSLRLLILDDDNASAETLLSLAESHDHRGRIVNTVGAARREIAKGEWDACLWRWPYAALTIPECVAMLADAERQGPVFVLTSQTTVEEAKTTMSGGASDYVQLPLTSESFAGMLKNAQPKPRASRKKKTGDEAAPTEIAVEDTASGSGHQPTAVFETSDPRFARLLKTAWKAARSSSGILLLGPSGTGKSVLAAAIHARSERRDHPFVSIHCPSLSPELLESELFGHVRGAFTGAVRDAVGKVELARGGTLFLDEVGELPPVIQAKLLRLLQERAYERVGEGETRESDLRFIFASNRDLADDVKEGKFREDLYFRINVITITMPSLAERPGDILPLARHYLQHFASREERGEMTFTPDAEVVLKGHTWPGNLRELRNAIERAVVLGEGGEVESGDLDEADSSEETAEELPGRACAGDNVSLAELDAQHIRRIVAITSTMQEASDILGIDPATLYRKRRQMDLD